MEIKQPKLRRQQMVLAFGMNCDRKVWILLNLTVLYDICI